MDLDAILVVGGTKMKMSDLFKTKKNVSMTIRVPEELKREVIRRAGPRSSLSNEATFLILRGIENEQRECDCDKNA